MTSNPTRPFGGNYSQPTPNFSRYTGPSFPPPGSNFYPPNPSIPLTNPYSGSSIGAYPSITFPSGPPLSFQPYFPPSSLPGSVTPPGISTGIPSYSRPPSSFNPNPPQGRSGVNPPIAPPGSIPAWVTTMQPSSLSNPPITPPGSIPTWVATMQPSSLFHTPSSDYRINNSPSIPSFASQPFSPTVPSFQSMNSFLPRTIGSQAVSSPPNYLGAGLFSPQLPSGQAGLPSTYSSLGGSPFLPSRGNSWTPPSSSSRRAHFNSDRAVVQWTPGYLSSYGQKPPSVEKDHNFQFTMLRKFEETARFMYQMHASPEKPFATWQTMGLTPLAIRISPQTTLFVDPLNLSSFFKRVSSAQAQETRASQEGHLASIGRAIAIVSSTEVQGFTKYVGIFLKNTLLTIEQLNPNPSRLHLTDRKSLSQAWETEAIPAIHRSIDSAYGTNIGAKYNPNNDGRVVQTIQNIALDPLWLVPMGRLVEGVNLTLRGATVTFQEIGSAIKTARVALEAPGAMKPAFANAGRSGLTQEARVAKTASSYDLQLIEKRTIQESKINEMTSQGLKVINPIEQKTPGNLQRQIELGKAPKGVERADKGRGNFEKDHIHFNDGSALNYDGTWKHGQRDLTREEIHWLKENGWNLPRINS